MHGRQCPRSPYPLNCSKEPPEAEQSGQTVDELAAQALERGIARCSLQRVKSGAETRRRGMTDEQIEERVNHAVQEYRVKQRSC